MAAAPSFARIGLPAGGEIFYDNLFQVFGRGDRRMWTSLILFAQEAKDKAPEGGGLLSGPNAILLPLGAVFMLFYFLVLRPQQRKQRQEQDNLMSNMKKNDEFITTSGIIGTVWKIEEAKAGRAHEVVLEIDDNARIHVLKSSIAQI